MSKWFAVRHGDIVLDQSVAGEYLAAERLCVLLSILFGVDLIVAFEVGCSDLLFELVVGKHPNENVLPLSHLLTHELAVE